MSSPQTTGPQVRTTTTEQTGIHYSTIYLHTVPGTLKCVCMVMREYNCVLMMCSNDDFDFSIFFLLFLRNQIFTLLGFLCVLFSDFKSSGVCQFFSTITMIAFWFSGILLVLYLFHVIYVMSKIPWTKIEFFFCVGAVFFLALTSALIVGKQDKWLIAGGVRINRLYKI